MLIILAIVIAVALIRTLLRAKPEALAEAPPRERTCDEAWADYYYDRQCSRDGIGR